VEWPKRFAAVQGNRDAEIPLREEFLRFRERWRQEKVACIRETQGSWQAAWGTEVEDNALKKFCDDVTGRFAFYFDELRHLETKAQRNEYVLQKFGKLGAKNYQDFARWYGRERNRCSQEITGWSAPSTIEESIRHIQTVSR
jgi:hypothetical protein